LACRAPSSFPCGALTIGGPGIWLLHLGDTKLVAVGLKLDTKESKPGFKGGCMNKKFLFATSAMLGFVGVASAADLAVQAPPYIAPTYDWSGFYFGGFVGGGWARNDTSESDLGIIAGTLVDAPAVKRTTGSSFIGGIEGGDRYQFGMALGGSSWPITRGRRRNLTIQHVDNRATLSHLAVRYHG
jgi:hypothetical protein